MRIYVKMDSCFTILQSRVLISVRLYLYHKFELLGVENILSEEEVAVFLVLALHRFLNEVVRIIVDDLPEVIYGKHDFSRPSMNYLNFTHIMIVHRNVYFVTIACFMYGRKIPSIYVQVVALPIVCPNNRISKRHNRG